MSKTNEENPWQTRTVTQVYDNPWIRLTHREVINPAGKDGIYGVVHFKNLAIGVVPLDKEQHTWLVGQYRYTLGRYSWEIPEGGCPVGTDPLETAKRELIEETGIRAGRWSRLLDIDISNSVTDETGIVFLARELSFGEANPEDTEKLEVRRIPFRQAVDMVLSGEITDSLSMVAILRVQLMLERDELAP
jgi:8-oxo-dGTP pyrophosphatase MutT (NUDIX family)